MAKISKFLKRQSLSIVRKARRTSWIRQDIYTTSRKFVLQKSTGNVAYVKS